MPAHVSLYFLIFYNSMQSHLMMSLRSENAWFAALSFGGYNIVLATALAFVGSVAGMLVNFAFGYYVSRWRDELPGYKHARFESIAGVFRRKLYLLLAVPPVAIMEVIPGVSLLPALAFLCGAFRVPPKRVIFAVLFSRAAYYTYYLNANLI